MITTYYKYLPAKFAYAMLMNGELRIGTLSDFKTIENAQRQDPQEGSGLINHYVRKQTFNSSNDPDIGLVSSVFKFNSPIEIENITFSKPVRFPDFYIYCVTTCPCEKVMKEFGPDCVCIEIIDMLEFGRIVGKVLQDMKLVTHEFIQGKCIYEGREIDVNQDIKTLLFTKDPFYEPQKEHRTVYYPVEQDPSYQLDPVIIRSPEIRRLIRRYSF